MSTMESEYVAMSMATQDLIPLHQTVHVVYDAVNIHPSMKGSFRSGVWDYNTRALTLTKLEPPRITPRSKHYPIKYHRLQEFTKSSNIGLNKIDTADQLVDNLAIF